MTSGRASGIIGREKRYDLDSWAALGLPWTKDALLTIPTLLDRQVRGVWVWSKTPGTGKTGLAVATITEWARTKREVTAANLSTCNSTIIRMCDMSSADFKDRAGVIESLRSGTIGLVALDDFHRMRWSSEYTSDFVHALIDSIYTRETSFIITANASPSAVLDYAGPDYEAAFDRLNDGGMAVIHASGESVRQ